MCASTDSTHPSPQIPAVCTCKTQSATIVGSSLTPTLEVSFPLLPLSVPRVRACVRSPARREMQERMERLDKLWSPMRWAMRLFAWAVAVGHPSPSSPHPKEARFLSRVLLTCGSLVGVTRALDLCAWS